MKISLIYPGITESGFNNLKGNEGSWMNHGLCSLSAVLKNKGHQVSLIDLRRLSGWEEFSQTVKASGADIFGISVMSVDLNTADTCARAIKKVCNATVVFGGAHPSIAPDQTLKNDAIDHVICGEGEISFLRLTESIAAGKTPSRLIEGIRPELDRLPFVDRELFAAREEPFVQFLKPPFLTVIAGRGCVYNCSYCQPAERKIFGNRVRRRSVANVMAELKELDARYSFNSFMFHDDCLTEDRKWIEEFCDAFRAAGLRKQFVCQSRADLVCRNRQMVKMLSDIGLELMIIGFESGSQRMLDFIGKGTKVSQNLEAAQICRSLGIKIWANYMLGLPGETKAEQRMTLEMIRKIRPYHCSPAYYTPHPGSRLFDYCEEHDLSLIKRPEDYRRNTYEPKIKGIDYEYLKGILYESCACGEDMGGRPARKAVYFLRRLGIPLKRPRLPAFIGRIGQLFRKKQKNISIELLTAGLSDPAKAFVNMSDVSHTREGWSAVSATDDAQIYLYDDPAKPVDSRHYRYIRFDLCSDSASMGHFIWWLADGRWQCARHFSIDPGWKEYCFDLKTMQTFGRQHGSGIGWEGQVCRLRLDPSEKPGVVTGIKNISLSVFAPPGYQGRKG